MAQAAWTRPGLRLSSWSCIGPRHRAASACSNTKEDGNAQEFSITKAQSSDPLISSHRTTTTIETIELPMSSSEGMEWTSEIECACSEEMGPHTDGNVDDGEDLVGHNRHEDHMNEVELWQQLEHELYDHTEDEDADRAEEIREEEAATIEEAGESQPESSSPEMKEAHRFFPPGKIMHIVTLQSNETETEGDATTSGDTGNGQTAETRVGIFLTPRSLYSKLRLSQTMISDHFMPVYRRQIEKLIGEFEKETTISGDNCNGETGEVVL